MSNKRILIIGNKYDSEMRCSLSDEWTAANPEENSLLYHHGSLEEYQVIEIFINKGWKFLGNFSNKLYFQRGR